MQCKNLNKSVNGLPESDEREWLTLCIPCLHSKDVLWQKRMALWEIGIKYKEDK